MQRGGALQYLITGGTGSLGSALTLRLLREGHKVRTLSRNQHHVAELEAKIPSAERVRFSPIEADIRDVSAVRDAVQGVNQVIHAAAQKVIHQCEYNPVEAADININGTAAVARACWEEGVEKALFISTDKACAPSTHYGKTKSVAETIWLGSNVKRPWSKPFCAIRYGNVWGSNGSVIWTFRRQYEAGQSVQVTDPKMTRFHLRITDAVNWCLRALEVLGPGELLVPKLPSYAILDLVSVAAPHAEILTTGRRPGEKLSESLISDNESPYCAKEEETYYVLKPGEVQQAGGWEYTSSTNQWRLSREQLKEEIEWLSPS